ncbi:hypothetical protein Tcan_07594 [Toxocara canis]|uniref:Uncharacterized protein n=1 Tax=Toxocara canis TaxID=6265 RepID=A0A0B2VER2_TOXCA|nr:hypothetical protein Tcan_07594 [Toxocara canis]
MEAGQSQESAQVRQRENESGRCQNAKWSRAKETSEHAVPLEASEKEKEARPMSNTKKFVKHLADKNLQERETEEAEENEPSVQPAEECTRTRYPQYWWY